MPPKSTHASKMADPFRISASSILMQRFRIIQPLMTTFENLMKKKNVRKPSKLACMKELATISFCSREFSNYLRISIVFFY